MAISMTDESVAKRKRKAHRQDETNVTENTSKKVKHLQPSVKIQSTVLAQVTQLEEDIKTSQKHYNNIVSLLRIAQDELNVEAQNAAVRSLCRVFCRLLAEGRLSITGGATENERLVTEWLNVKFEDYKQVLMSMLESSDSTSRFLSLPLAMAISQEEIIGCIHSNSNSEAIWKKGTFGMILDLMLWTSGNRELCQRFVEQYVQPFNDVRHHTFILITETLLKGSGTRNNAQAIENSLFIMSAIDKVDEKSYSSPGTLLCDVVLSGNKKSNRYEDHRKLGQKAWLALFGSGLNKDQRKLALRIMTDKIVPWFRNVEMLMDFLTDSYDVGGATSLLSLSGLFFLIQQRNLDYPDFYTKLYSLLNHQLLHSRHRSSFFRLMYKFLSSTHLPAAMVASFIKRLSRLALYAPPGGIVAIIPWIYNILKEHVTCTFMIHREPRTDEERQEYKLRGLVDPFSMDETDPMLTGAIDSCLWELVSLQSHYHPNVAALAKIISEQFTKKEYNLEDFLDHSYGGLIDTELGRDIAKTPVVEFEIPKKIFVDSAGNKGLETMMQRILDDS